jgi:hypothetical protein
MTSRGGGDPNNSMASMPSAEWARRLGASPSKRMTASWSGSNTDPTEYKVAARCFAPNGGLPSGRSHRELDIQIPIQGVVGDLRMAARRVLAARDIRATAFDPHSSPSIGRGSHARCWRHAKQDRDREKCPRLPELVEPWPGGYGVGGSSVSRLARLRRGALRPSSGLSILDIIPVATRV